MTEKSACLECEIEFDNMEDHISHLKHEHDKKSPKPEKEATVRKPISPTVENVVRGELSHQSQEKLTTENFADGIIKGFNKKHFNNIYSTDKVFKIIINKTLAKVKEDIFEEINKRIMYLSKSTWGFDQFKLDELRTLIFILEQKKYWKELGVK